MQAQAIVQNVHHAELAATLANKTQDFTRDGVRDAHLQRLLKDDSRAAHHGSVFDIEFAGFAHTSHRLPHRYLSGDVIIDWVCCSVACGFNARGTAKGGVLDRKSVVEGKSESVRVGLGGRGIIKKKIEQRTA